MSPEPNSEGMGLIMLALTRDLHEAGLFGQGLCHSVQLKLPFDLHIFTDKLADLVVMSPSPASLAASFGSIGLTSHPCGDRRLAVSAKDRVREAINRNVRTFVRDVESPIKLAEN